MNQTLKIFGSLIALPFWVGSVGATGMAGGVCLSGASPMITGCTAINPAMDVVVTTEGRFSCPTWALSTGGITLSLCAQDSNSTGHGGDLRMPIVCLPVAPADPSSSGNTATNTVGNTTTSNSTTMCTSPGLLYRLQNLGSIPTTCPGGGTRAIQGGWDAATGKLDVVITFADCVDRGGANHTGTATMQGTLTSPSAGVWLIEDSKTVADSIVFPTGNTLKRSCTLTRNGTLNENTHTFQGTSSRNNCTLDGTYSYHGSVIDKMIDNATEMEPF